MLQERSLLSAERICFVRFAVSKLTIPVLDPDLRFWVGDPETVSVRSKAGALK